MNEVEIGIQKALDSLDTAVKIGHMIGSPEYLSGLCWAKSIVYEFNEWREKEIRQTEKIAKLALLASLIAAAGAFIAILISIS